MLGGLGVGHHRRHVHQLGGLQPGLVRGALRAIAAILGAAAGLDRQKCGNLHFVGREMPPVDGLRPENQVGEGQGEQGGQLLARPVVADVVHAVTFISWAFMPL